MKITSTIRLFRLQMQSDDFTYMLGCVIRLNRQPKLASGQSWLFEIRSVNINILDIEWLIGSVSRATISLRIFS